MEQHLGELDRHIGPAAVLSLTQRALVPEPGRGVQVGSTPGLTERVTGAMVGMALGHAVGFPVEWEPPARRRIDGIPTGRAQAGAEVELACWSLETILDHDLGAAPALAERLRRAPRLYRPGNAVPATIRSLRRGVPWFEAGVGSFGSGAATRAVGVGIAMRDRPEWRPLAAALDASVTHASVDAVAVSAVVADAVACFLALPVDADDPIAVIDSLVAITPAGIGAIALQLARHRLVTDGPAPYSGAQAIDALAAALFYALRNLRKAQRALADVVSAGGDTDTVGALVGAFVGAANGVDIFPPTWRTELRSTARLTALAERAVPGGARTVEPTP
ncbi:MAG TPA: ADP-ribosylglycohydrolase family protein, partial [Acidimicrobiia bacterium]|nr:ADP-ribosylglycohydrolase family protein [Acidimicrobiia bacterium]